MGGGGSSIDTLIESTVKERGADRWVQGVEGGDRWVEGDGACVVQPKLGDYGSSRSNLLIYTCLSTKRQSGFILRYEILPCNQEVVAGTQVITVQ